MKNYSDLTFDFLTEQWDLGKFHKTIQEEVKWNSGSWGWNQNRVFTRCLLQLALISSKTLTIKNRRGLNPHRCWWIVKTNLLFCFPTDTLLQFLHNLLSQLTRVSGRVCIRCVYLMTAALLNWQDVQTYTRSSHYCLLLKFCVDTNTLWMTISAKCDLSNIYPMKFDFILIFLNLT